VQNSQCGLLDIAHPGECAGTQDEKTMQNAYPCVFPDIFAREGASIGDLDKWRSASRMR
jgi:hypothetical protein